MKNRLKGFIFFLLIGNYTIAQEAKTIDSLSNNNLSAINDTLAESSFNQEEKFTINPTLGLGIGMFSFFGDVYDKNFQSPTISKIAYDLSISNAISENFILSFNVLFGKLGANERLAANNRNLNFESQIRAGGINIAYNFGHFLPKERKITPYISLGIETFEFVSKTDAFDKNGNEYFYWTDGSIRNIDQNASDANNAVEIERDYVYESDIRELNLDGFGKYAERSFAIPVGLGILFEINDYIDFKLGTAMHFTFTDYIDGVTFTSKGNRKGNNKDDKFMMTSCAISYNFGSNKKASDLVENEQYLGIDFMAIDSSDYDGDGVVDLRDSCQGTPLGELVDAKGCPTDSDQDNHPNYEDDEINSPPNAIVDVKGVEMSDSLIEDRYLYYLDPSQNMLDFTTFSDQKGMSAMTDSIQKSNPSATGTTVKEAHIKPTMIEAPDKRMQDIVKKNTEKPSQTPTGIEKATPNEPVLKTTNMEKVSMEEKQAKTAAPLATKETSKPTKTYVILPGDNLAKISKKHDCTIEELKTWNHLKNDKVFAGKTLVVSNPTKDDTIKNNSLDAVDQVKDAASNTSKQMDESKEAKQSTTATPLANKEASNPNKTYLIQPGDNLAKISKKHGCTIEELKTWNNLKNDNVFAGKTLVIGNSTSNASLKKEETASKNTDNANGGEYTIQRGDNLGSIAKKYGCSVKDLMKWNGLPNVNIRAGQKLIVKDINSKH